MAGRASRAWGVDRSGARYGAVFRMATPSAERSANSRGALGIGGETHCSARGESYLAGSAGRLLLAPGTSRGAKSGVGVRHEDHVAHVRCTSDRRKVSQQPIQ